MVYLLLNVVCCSMGRGAPVHTQPLELPDPKSTSSRVSPSPQGRPCAPVVAPAVQTRLRLQELLIITINI